MMKQRKGLKNLEWNMVWNGMEYGMEHRMEWNREWNTAWNGSLEQRHGTELERKNFVWNRCMEYHWKGNTFVWNSCMEQKSGTYAWNRTGTKILLSGTAALNGSLEQLHGTELEWKYFFWNSCMERKNSKWVWSGNTTITNFRQPRGTARKSRPTITRHQEDKLSKAISSIFPIKMIAILEWT